MAIGFLAIGIASLLSVWGLFRAVSVWQYRGRYPLVIPHTIAAVVVCGIPLVLALLLFGMILLRMLQGQAPLWD